MSSAPEGLVPGPAPEWGSATLADVLPSVASALGVDGFRNPLGLTPCRRAVVVLVDGLGLELLRRRGGHAPFLRSLLPEAQALTCGFPSTTATSMGSFGTGLPPGAHGLVGYEVLDPARDAVFNELSWEDGPAPEQWQPEATVFERVAAAGIGVTRTGPGFFDGSGLTRAALRGGRFVASDALAGRVADVVAAVGRSPRELAYLYWGDLDKVGHLHGCGSWQWGDELEAVDSALRRLAESVSADCQVVITADHGMIDAPFETRLDLADAPALARGIRHVAGEPRCLQLHCEPGAREDVHAAWAATLGSRARLWRREEIVEAGWFGPRVLDRVLPRIGEIVVTMQGDFAVVDSRTMRPEVLRLLGYHGSITRDELAIPALVVPARSS